MKHCGETLIIEASNSNQHRPRKHREVCCWSAVCVVVLCVIPVLLFPLAAFGRQTWTGGDMGSYNHPLHVEILRQWRSGVIPLWNPHVTSGTPLAAAMQGGVFYPLNWPLILLPDSIGLTISMLAHVALTGIFAFGYLRSIGLSRWASLTGGIVFQMSGFVMSHMGHVALLRATPWLPFVLLAVQKWSERRDWRWVCVSALGVGCSFLAGYPQISAYSAMTWLSYLVFLFFQAGRGRWRFLAGGIALFVLGVGLAAVQLTLTAAVWREYMRVLSGSFEYFTLYSFHPSYIVRLIAPAPASEMEGYVGVPTLLLVFLNPLVRHPRRRGRLLAFYAALAVVSLLLAFGRYTVLAEWTYPIPVYGSFSVLSRHLLEFDFSMAVLAASGLDILLAFAAGRQLGWVSRRQGAVRAVICVGLLLGWVVIWLSAGPGVPDNRSPALVWNDQVACGLVRAAALALATLSVAWLARCARRPRLGLAMLLLLLLGDLSRTTGRIYVRQLHSPDQMTVPSDLVAFLEREGEPYRVMSFVPHGNAPFFGEARRAKWLLPNFNVLNAIESATGYDAVMLAQLDAVTDHTLPTHGLVEIQALYNPSFVRYLNLVGARYFIVPIELAIPDDLAKRYPPVFENQWVRVLRNASALPRVFHVSQFETVPPTQVAVAVQGGEWNDRSFDFNSLALVEHPENGQLVLDPGVQAFGSTLSLVSYALVPDGPQEGGVGDDWRLVTQWACQMQVPRDYTLYVHFLDDHDQTVAQADHLLGQETAVGFHPTQAWSCPAVVEDRVLVPRDLLADLADVRVAIGVWKPETGERLHPHPGALFIDQYGRVVLGYAADMASAPSTARMMSGPEVGEDWASVELELNAGAIVVHSSNYSEGWSARIDGRSAQVVRVDGFLQGVYVPAGQHQVEFVYRPAGFYVGLGISAFTVGLMGLVLWGRAIGCNRPDPVISPPGRASPVGGWRGIR
jgi:hypothetical protein